MNPENRTWRPLDPVAESLPEGLESALGDGDSAFACVVVLVDSEIDCGWGAQASLTVARGWAESGRVPSHPRGCVPGSSGAPPVGSASRMARVCATWCSMGHRFFRESHGLSERACTWSRRNTGRSSGRRRRSDAPEMGRRDSWVYLLGDGSDSRLSRVDRNTRCAGSDRASRRGPGARPSSRDVDTMLDRERMGSADRGSGSGERRRPLRRSDFQLPARHQHFIAPIGLGITLPITLPDPKEAVAGVAEKPLVELASASDAIAELKAAVARTEDVLGVEGGPGLLEEEAPGAFLVDESPDLAASEGEEGATSDAGVASLSGSSLAVSEPTVTAGETVTLTLTARDAGGNLLAGLASVAFGHTGGTATGDISAVTDQGDGNYSAIFTGRTSGTATTFQATIDAEAVTSTLPTMTVTIGPPSLSNSTVVVSAATVGAGGAVALTLTARDTCGNQVAGLTTVAFSHTGGTSTGDISAVTYQGDGTYTGRDVTLTLTARDPGGNLVSGLTEVAFDHTGGESPGEISAVTDQGDGTYTATFTGQTAGTATTLLATIELETVTQTADVAVTLGAVSLSGSSLAVSEPTVAAGESVTLTLMARDAGGNLLAGLTNVALDHTGGTSTGDISAVTGHGDGTYTATFTGRTVGTAATLQATVDGETVAQAADVTVVLGAVSLSGSSFAVSKPTVVAGETVSLTLTARDAGGNLFAGLTNVAFGRTGGTGTGDISAVTEQGDGTYTATFTGKTAGTATTIEATIDGETVAQTADVAVMVGAPSLTLSTVDVWAPTVAAGEDVTLTLTARDPGGNLLAGLTDVAFGHTGGSSIGDICAVTDQGDGTYTATFTGQTAGTATTLQATIDGEAVASTLPTMNVTLGTPSLSKSTVVVSADTVTAGGVVALTLTVRDPGSNLLIGLTEVAFDHTGGGSTGEISAVTDQGDGTYIAIFTGQTAGTATALQATIDGEAVTSTVPTMTVTLGPPSLSNSTVVVSAALVEAGAAVTLTLTARDPGGNLLSGLTEVAFDPTGGERAGEISATTDQDDGTYTATFTGRTAGNVTTLQATIDGETVVQSAVWSSPWGRSL